MIDALISHKRTNWRTPTSLFYRLNEKYNFTFDLACTTQDCVCLTGFFCDKGVDALDEDWHKINGWLFCNPPYGLLLPKFVEKAFKESLLGASIVMLIPVRTSTNYWHDYIHDKLNVSVEYLKGRLHFDDGFTAAPFDSCIVVFSY